MITQMISNFLKESIGLELNVGELYQIFSAKFPEDKDFWWKISMEEMNHAALIESINDMFLTDAILSTDSIEMQTDALCDLNISLKSKIEQYRLVPPSRLDAFQDAYEIENSVGEFHFELLMTTIPESSVTKIFQKLNGDDVNHATRIKSYILEKGVV